MQIKVLVYNQKLNGKQLDCDTTAHHDPSHLYLHYLHGCLFWSAGLKGLNLIEFENKRKHHENMPIKR